MAKSILALSGIYAIRNVINDKRYIGSATRFSRRFREHKRQLKGGWHHSIKLQRAWSKHGEDVFSFEVLELVEDANALLSIEQKWIDLYVSHGHNGYNVLQTAGSRLGMHNTPEAIEKTAAANRGRKRTPEQIESLAAHRRGVKASDETRKKLSDSHKGKTLSPEQRAKISAANTGKRCSQKCRELSRARMMGNQYGVGRAVFLGRKQSPETIAKRRASSIGRKRGPEALKNLLAGWAKRKLKARMAMGVAA